LLGSPVDVGALGAARALDRTLRAAGLDLHDLASAIEKPAEVRTVVQYRERYPDRKITWGDIAGWCRDNGRPNAKLYRAENAA
jgi:hypothetical protein